MAGAGTCTLPHPCAARLGRGRRAISLPETLVATAIVTLIGGVVLVMIAKARTSAQSITCLTNLQHLHVAFIQYASENQGRLPDPEAAQLSWEQMLRPYLGGMQTLQCPSDQEVFPSLGSSYDWRDAGDRNLSIAGSSLAGVNPCLVLAFDSLPAWHAAKKINVVLLSGTTFSMDQNECFKNLQLLPNGQPGP